MDTKLGRIVLHVRCFLKTGRFRWHMAGILREFTEARS